MDDQDSLEWWILENDESERFATELYMQYSIS